MNNKIYILFFILFFIVGIPTLVIACTPTGPCEGGGYWCVCGYLDSYSFNGTPVLFKEIGNYDLYLGDQVPIFVNYYCAGYNELQLSINELDADAEWLIINMTNLDINRFCDYENAYCVDIQYSGSEYYGKLTLTNKGYPDTETLILYCINTTDGESYVSSEFNVTHSNFYNTTSTYSDIYLTNESLQNPTNWFVHYGYTFRSIFPDSSTLSYSDRISIVLISIMLITLIAYIIIYLVTKETGFPSFAHYLIIMAIVLLMMFFVSINYIPMIYIIILILVVSLFKALPNVGFKNVSLGGK